MNQVLWYIIAGGALSIVYGALTTRSLLAASPGNARMQEIAAAIQEGAQAYLTRQYTTIAMAGAVIFVLLAFLLSFTVAIGLPDRRGAFGRGRLHRHARFGARQCAHRQAASQGLAQGLSMAFRAGAVTGLLVAGLALLGVACYYGVLTGLAAL